jgi:asparagine synthase (glutamine-hydrolysing)
MQLVSDAPVGIDSGAVAALASEGSRDPIHTFTIGFEEAELDESYFAAQVAAAIGTHHTNIMVSEEDFLRQLPVALSSIDQPTLDGINTFFVSNAARGAGMTVALSGTGGDELFGGYPSFKELPRLLRATSWWPNGALKQFIKGTTGIASSFLWNNLHQSPPQTRWGKIVDVVCATNDLLGLYQVSYSLFTRETQERMASDQVRVAQSSQDFGLPPDVGRAWRARIEGSEHRQAVSLLEMSSFIGERLLRDTDAASMAVALEVRVPLLDHVLWETLAGIDPERRFSPTGKKQLLRDLALCRLDPSLFDRPKSGFVLPINSWARHRLKPEMDLLLTDADLVSSVGLCPEVVQTLWASYLKGKPGLHWSRVWAIYVLLAWCRRYSVVLAT